MKSLILLLSTFTISINFTNAQWQQTNGPLGGNVTATTINGSRIFAGTNDNVGNGGIYYSDDNGANWIEDTIGIGNLPITYLLVNDGKLFAGTSLLLFPTRGGLFTSMNNGASWTKVPDLGFFDVSVIAANGNNVFVDGTGLLFRSTDNGTTWSQVTSGIDPLSVYAMTFSGSKVFAGTDNGVYLSIDTGKTWTPANTGLELKIIALTSVGNKVIAAAGGATWTTNDDGKHWLFTSSLVVNALTVSGNNVIAGAGGIYISSDKGNSWSLAGLNFNSIHALATNGDTVFAGAEYGGGISINNGEYWTRAGVSNTSSVLSLTTIGNDLLAGAEFAGAYRSSDGGANWLAIDSGFTNYSVVALATDGTNLFAGTPDGIFLSIDNGTSWSAVDNGLTNRFISTLVFNGNNLFAGADAGNSGGVFLSTDQGANWSNLGLSSYRISSLAIKGSKIFAGTKGNGIFISSDTGKTWTAANNGLTTLYVWSLALCGNTIFAGTDNGSNDGVFISNDDGLSWSFSSNGMPANSQIFAFEVIGNNIFAGTGASGVFLSTDNGASWIAVNTGFTSANPNVWAFAATATELYAGISGNGVWKQPLSQIITAVNEIHGNPVISVYPNPFANELVVTGTVATGEIIIYNLIGNEILRQKTSSSQTIINTEKLLPGYYLLNYISGNRTENKKVVKF